MSDVVKPVDDSGDFKINPLGTLQPRPSSIGNEHFEYTTVEFTHNDIDGCYEWKLSVNVRFQGGSSTSTVTMNKKVCLEQGHSYTLQATDIAWPSGQPKNDQTVQEMGDVNSTLERVGPCPCPAS